MNKRLGIVQDSAKRARRLLTRTMRGIQFSDAYNRHVPAPGLERAREDVVWVDTDRITETGLNYDRGNLRRSIGTVRGGDWDLMRMQVDDLAVVRFLKAHFENGVSLKDTPFYNPHIQTKKQANSLPHNSWSYITAYDYDRRMKRIRDLYESMKRDGYKTSAQLGGPAWDEIIVKIGRDGDMLFENSIHRLAVAKILGIPRVPVVVSVRHQDWVTFKRTLFRYAGFSRKRTLYQKVTHPDLQSIPYHHDCEDKMALMRRHLRSGAGALLDIGANLGYFCHCFAELGFECDASEFDPMTSLLIERLFQIEKRSCRVLQGDILTPGLPALRTHYDVVLALAIFHHFLKQPDRTEKLKAFLGRVSMNEMFFIPHRVDEQPMLSAHLNLQNEEFVEFILEHSCLTHSECIGELADHRRMYHLWCESA